MHYLVEVKMFKKSGKKTKLYWHVNVPVTMGTIPLNPANAAAQANRDTPHTATLTCPNVSIKHPCAGVKRSTIPPPGVWGVKIFNEVFSE